MSFQEIRAKLSYLSRVHVGYLLGLLLLLAAYTRTQLPPFHSRLKIALNEGSTGVPLLHTAEAFSTTHDVEIVLDTYDNLFNREWLALHATGDAERFDVIMLDDPWLAQFATPEKQGAAPLLRPLEGELQARLASGYFEKSCSRVCRIPYCDDESPCTNDSQYFAVPFVANTQLFARGPDIAEPPADWDAVMAQKARLESSNRPILGYAMRRGPGNSIVTDFMPVLWSYCPNCWRNQIGEVGEGGENAMAKLLELSWHPPSGRRLGFADESLDDFDLSAYWAKDATAMGLVWSSWAMSLANIRAADGVNHKPLQYGPVPNKKPTLGAWLMAIPANAANPKLAKTFLAWATEKEQLRVAAWQGNPPPIAGLLAEDGLRQKYDFYQAQEQALRQAHPRPRTPCWKALESQIGEILYDMTAGLFPASQARARIDGVVRASECNPSKK
jgi:spermidine/putrescine-binding protein